MNDKQNYLKNMVDVAVAFGATNLTRTKDECGKIVQLEIDIHGLNKNRSVLVKLEPNDTSNNLNANFLVAFVKKTFFFSRTVWVNFFAEIMPLETQANITIYYPSTYFGELSKTLEQYSKRTISNYLQWKLIESLSKYVLDKTITFYDDTMARAKARWHFCVDIVREQLPAALVALFVRHFSKDSTQLALERIYNNVRHQIDLKFSTAPWVRPQDLSFILNILNSVDIVIGAHNDLRNMTTLLEHYSLLDDLSETHFFESILRLRAFNYHRRFRQELMLLQNDSTIWAEDYRLIGELYSFYDHRVHKICETRLKLCKFKFNHLFFFSYFAGHGGKPVHIYCRSSGIHKLCIRSIFDGPRNIACISFDETLGGRYDYKIRVSEKF